MKQAPSTKTDGINTQLNLDMSPAELLERLEAKHGPLSDEEIKNARGTLLTILKENVWGVRFKNQGQIEKALIKNICVEFNKRFLEDDSEANDQLDSGAEEHEVLRTYSHNAEPMIKHKPQDLLITKLILDFIMSQQFNFQLRQLIREYTGTHDLEVLRERGNFYFQLMWRKELDHRVNNDSEVLGESLEAERLKKYYGKRYMQKLRARESRKEYNWNGKGPVENYNAVFEIIVRNIHRENWLERVKNELEVKYLPVSNPDFDFLMDYLRKIAQKDSDTPSRSSKTRKKVSNILDQKK